jgi:hypothetical protein
MVAKNRVIVVRLSRDQYLSQNRRNEDRLGCHVCPFKDCSYSSRRCLTLCSCRRSGEAQNLPRRVEQDAGIHVTRRSWAEKKSTGHGALYESNVADVSLDVRCGCCFSFLLWSHPRRAVKSDFACKTPSLCAWIGLSFISFDKKSTAPSLFSKRRPNRGERSAARREQVRRSE